MDNTQVRMTNTTVGLEARVMPEAVLYWESRGWIVDPDGPSGHPTTAEGRSLALALLFGV